MRAAIKRHVILMYHSISNGSSPLRIAPALFAEQMEWLSKNARVIPLSQVVGALEQRTPLPQRTVVLTFDDGFADFYTEAAPVLKRFGFSAIVFLPTAYCGLTNAWPGQPSWVEKQPLMTWEQIVELATEGVNFGAHSISHPVLTQLERSEAEREIVGSKREIEARIEQSVEYFSYPYGRWNAGLCRVVRCYYRGACTTAARLLDGHADPLALPRVDANYLRRPHCFRSLFTPRFCAYLAARRWVRRVRRQPEGS